MTGRNGASGHLQNVLVKDLATGEERLLLSQRALIERLRAPDAHCETEEGIAHCGHLYWELRPVDTNGDGSIDPSDASVAYLSDLRASQLTLISPPLHTELSACTHVRPRPPRSPKSHPLCHALPASGMA